MRFGFHKLLVVTIAAATLLTGIAWSQTSTTEEGKRKVKAKSAPVYPELARRMNVSGKVKIEVVITNDGHVRSTRVLGGHPLLVQACQQAVKEWAFSPASEESTQIVEFEFHNTSN